MGPVLAKALVRASAAARFSGGRGKVLLIQVGQSGKGGWKPGSFFVFCFVRSCKCVVATKKVVCPGPR